MLSDGRPLEEPQLRCANELVIIGGAGRRNLPCVCEHGHRGACTFEPEESGTATGMVAMMADGYLVQLDVGPSQHVTVRDGETVSIQLSTYLE